MQLKWVDGFADRELYHDAPITSRVTGAGSDPTPSGQESPKGGVGSPAGFARGAGREWALPVFEAGQSTPETMLVS